jgi:TIR domain
VVAYATAVGHHVFISYVRDNRDVVDRLATELRAAGVDVWLDRERLRPGERWKTAIREAIHSGILFVACFSREYAARDASYMNQELTLAIDELRLRPVDRRWFVSLVLSGGEVPLINRRRGNTSRPPLGEHRGWLGVRSNCDCAGRLGRSPRQ